MSSAQTPSDIAARVRLALWNYAHANGAIFAEVHFHAQYTVYLGQHNRRAQALRTLFMRCSYIYIWDAVDSVYVVFVEGARFAILD